MRSEPEFDAAFIDAVARRLLDLSRRKLRVSDVARIYDVHPTWVYAHADRLGAIRLGNGPKAPLRFDAETVEAAFKTLADGRGEPVAVVEPPTPPSPSAPRRRRTREAGHQTELLPIKGEVPDASRPISSSVRRPPRRPS